MFNRACGNDILNMSEKNQHNEAVLCSEPVFKSVFESHFKLLRNYLVFKYKCIDRAEDAAQNAFVILWQNCSLIKPEQARSFLFTTANRLSLNAIKHENIVNKFALEAKPESIQKETPESVLMQTELKQKLEKAIAALPEKQRIVFLMNRFENQTYAEIADLLELSVKAVEKRMHLALKLLRDTMKP